MNFFKFTKKTKTLSNENPERYRTIVLGNSTVTVGRFTYGYENCTVHQWGEGANLQIGSFCSIAGGVHIFLGGNHRTDWITTYPFGHIFKNELTREKTPGHPITKGNVTIGNDVWIAHGATILSGVTIGNGAVIGACAVLRESVPEYTVVGGNPAKVLRPRFEADIIDMLKELKWWELPKHQILKLIPILQKQPDRDLLLSLVERHRKT